MNNKTLQKLTNNAKKSLLKSILISKNYKAKKVTDKHLLLAILSQKGSLGRNILIQIGGEALLKQKFIKQYESSSFDKNELFTLFNHKINSDILNNFSENLKNVLVRAFSLAGVAGFPFVGTEHLVYALIENPSLEIKKILSNFKSSFKNSPNSSETSFSNNIIQSKISLEQLAKIFNIPLAHNFSSEENENLSEQSFIKYFGENFNEKDNTKENPIIGRNKELEKIIDVLNRRNKNNPLLIGEPGIGKTAIVEKLAHRINTGNVPPQLLNKKIINLDLASVIAGTTFRGEFEGRLKKIIDEVKRNKDIILFIDEIHSIVGAGSSNGSLDAANILKPALSRGEIQCIGATTFEEYKKYIEKDAALERRFQTIQIQEPSFNETVKILKGLIPQLEKHHQVIIPKTILHHAVELTQHYLPERFLPDKAIDILDESASHLRNQQKNSLTKKLFLAKLEEKKINQKKNQLIAQENYEQAIELEKKERKTIAEIKQIKKQLNLQKQKFKKPCLDLIHISQTISQYSGVPVEKILSLHSSSLNSLQKRLQQKIVGQNQIIKKITDTLYYSQSGISFSQKPMGSFLFIGPTGVGKTYLAQILAEEYFGTTRALVRIDMSEFMERHNVSRLIGSPAGYIGYEEGGKLTEKIRRQPYSLVLFDEIEKAHPDVSNLLLQILEDGYLTDASGRKVDFKNTIVILTSNLGTRKFDLANPIGFSSSNDKNNKSISINKIKRGVLNDLKKRYPPELLNRLDYKLVFNSLDEKALKRIIRLQLSQLRKDLRKQNIYLNYDNKIINQLVKESLSLHEGARLIRKKIKRKVKIPLAKIILQHKAKSNQFPLKISIQTSLKEIKFNITT